MACRACPAARVLPRIWPNVWVCRCFSFSTCQGNRSRRPQLPPASPSYHPAVRVGGVVLNKLGSERHRSLIADALMPLRIPVLGAIPRDETLVLPERHLGLVQASEHADLSARLARFAEMAARHLDLDAIMAMAAPLASAAIAPAPLKPPGQRIAIGVGRSLFFRLCPRARWLASRRRGDRAVLAAA